MENRNVRRIKLKQRLENGKPSMQNDTDILIYLNPDLNFMCFHICRKSCLTFLKATKGRRLLHRHEGDRTCHFVVLNTVSLSKIPEQKFPKFAYSVAHVRVLGIETFHLKRLKLPCVFRLKTVILKFSSCQAKPAICISTFLFSNSCTPMLS